MTDIQEYAHVEGEQVVIHFPPGQSRIGDGLMDNLEIAKQLIAAWERGESLVMPTTWQMLIKQADGTIVTLGSLCEPT